MSVTRLYGGLFVSDHDGNAGLRCIAAETMLRPFRRGFAPMKFRILLAACTALAVAAPAAAQEGMPQARKVFPFGAQWLAVSLNGKRYDMNDRPALNIDSQMRARGFGGCNTFSATSYPLNQQRFAVGPIALTKKACTPALMELEREFLVALRTAQQWDLSGGALILRGQAGELRFERTF